MNMSFPLDMGQFKNVLFSTRIPGHEIDVIQKAPENTRHVVVFYRGRAYAVNAFTESMVPRDPADILADLDAIEADGQARGFNEDAVCALTSTTRDVWASNREHLIELGNAEALDVVDHGMFALCLDDFAYTGPDDCMKQHIAGKSQNRWPEKSFMVVMGHCGKAGVVFEHAWGDGAAVLHFMNSVNHHVTEIVQGDFAGPPLAADTLKASSNGVLNEIKFKVCCFIQTGSHCNFRWMKRFPMKSREQ